MRVNPLALAASFPYLICHWGGQQRVGGWPDKLLQWIGSGQQAAAWAFWFALQKKKKKKGFIQISDPACLERHVH